MSWPRLLLEYARKLLRAIPWRARVQRVHRLEASDYLLRSPTFGTPALKLSETPVHHLRARNYDLREPSFPGDSPAVARVRKSLVRLMHNYPRPNMLKAEHRTKQAIFKIYRNRVPELSRRTFDELWDYAISVTGAIAYRERGSRPQN
jgi:hypothetical protein